MGTSGSSTRPSAWSRRRSSSAGKRAANGARGLSRSAPTDLKPSRRSVVQVSGESRNASIGSGANASASCPEAGRRRARRESATAPRPRRAWRQRRAAPAGRNFFPAGQKDRRCSAFLAAEQMRGAFDVEEKTVGAVLLAPIRTGRGGRRIARRPQRQAAQRGIVGGGIDGAHLQVVPLSPAHRPKARRARGPAASAASFKAAMRGPPAAAMARTNGRSGSMGLSEGVFRLPAPRESAGSASAAARLKRCAT